MSEFINAYNNSWPFVQIFILATLLGLVALPVWLAHRWLTKRKKMRDNILFALAQEGDVVTLTVRQGAPIRPNQLTEPTSQADIQAKPIRAD